MVVVKKSGGSGRCGRCEWVAGKLVVSGCE